jgi:hypothetical protein
MKQTSCRRLLFGDTDHFPRDWNKEPVEVVSTGLAASVVRFDSIFESLSLLWYVTIPRSETSSSEHVEGDTN